MGNKIALLIDAENTSVKYLDTIMEEVKQYGDTTFQRMYGDFSSTKMQEWSKKTIQYAIVPIHQAIYTSGKNAADIMLVIDAMDIMFQDNVDGFCIVSSDSDFTRLVSRLRESGKRVIGMGNSCASKTFISACNEYKFIDKFIEDDNVKDSTEEHSAMTPLSDIINTIARIVQQSENKGEYARLSTTKSCILQQYPDFDERNYGYTIFRKLIEEKTEFKLRQESSTVYIISDNTKIKNNSNKIEKFIYSIIETNKQFGLGNLANEIHNHFPNFNHKALGYSTFKKYISSIQWLKINAKNPTCLYVTINKSSKIQPT